MVKFGGYIYPDKYYLKATTSRSVVILVMITRFTAKLNKALKVDVESRLHIFVASIDLPPRQISCPAGWR